MRRLRDPERGCPWDREQTWASIAPHTIEEAYELEDAICKGDSRHVRDELGDLLFQVVCQARIAEEAGAFAFDDVVDSICDKLERRLEGIVDFRPVEPELESGRHVGDNRCHDEAGDDQMIVQVADAAEPVAGQSDFLLRLAYRRFPRSGVGVLDPPAREAHLARVIRELRRALREQDRQAFRPVDQRNQHGGT